MSDNFYEYATLNIDPRDDLLDCRYMIRKKLGAGLTSMVYLLEKKACQRSSFGAEMWNSRISFQFVIIISTGNDVPE
ncbi:unnamed protein product [Rotaria sp. Silwood1]|nr:unnamed protein product [Rotaria sp. Silwood1]